MLAVVVASPALIQPPSSALLSSTLSLVPASPMRRSATVQLSLRHERIESAKACVIAAFGGTIASAPVKLGLLSANTDKWATAVSQWEVGAAVMAVQLALFGVVYRCAVRCDDSTPLRQDAVAAASLCSALSALPVTKLWTSGKLFSGPIVEQFLLHVAENGVAFTFAAAALEYAWSRGYADPLPGIGLPPDERYDYDRRPQRYYYDQPRQFYGQPPPSPPFDRSPQFDRSYYDSSRFLPPSGSRVLDQRDRRFARGDYYEGRIRPTRARDPRRMPTNRYDI